MNKAKSSFVLNAALALMWLSVLCGESFSSKPNIIAEIAFGVAFVAYAILALIDWLKI